MSRGAVIALVGAESTGKSTLADELAAALAGRGHAAVVVGEALREFCDRQGRTPRREEQAGIADEQTRRIAIARNDAEVVIADTTALMIAVYSDLVFADRSLYPTAESAQRGYELTLLTALDLPWVADGHQRDGEHVRVPVDERIRGALARAGVAWTTVAGQGPARLAAALAAAGQTLARLAE